MSGDAARQDVLDPKGEDSSGTAGSIARRVGVAIVVASATLAVAAALILLLAAPTLAAGIEAAFAAATTPPTRGVSLPGLVYVGVLGVLVGAWYLGVGLIMSGLYD